MKAVFFPLYFEVGMVLQVSNALIYIKRKCDLGII